MSTFAASHAAGDKVRGTQRFGHDAVDGKALQCPPRIIDADPCALHEQSGGGFHRPGLFDKTPFAQTAGHVLEQRRLDAGQIRAAAHDGHDGQMQRLIQRLEVYDVEAGKGDSLEQDEMYVRHKT